MGLFARRCMFSLSALLFLSLSRCATQASFRDLSALPSHKVALTILHMNDIYEITPLPGSGLGGLARVASLKKQALKANGNVISILAGDYLSPSAIGSAVVEGAPLSGKQMVDVLNRAGLDLACLGNHEFDLSEKEFLLRAKESRFRLLTTNVRDKKGAFFPQTVSSEIRTFRNEFGKEIRVGFLGLTLNSNKKPYVTYLDVAEQAKKEAAVLRGQVDILIAVTHLNIAEDIALGEKVPEIDLILGGHEHERTAQTAGKKKTPIFKADANAESVYVLELTYDTGSHHLEIDSKIEKMDKSQPSDPIVAAAANEWRKKALDGFITQGIHPEEIVGKLKETWLGKEGEVRNRPTNLTKAIAESMLKDLPQADFAVFNSGSIRLDDNIAPGPITQYDLLRILPFGGNSVLVQMSGRLAKKVLDQGLLNKGSGGFLQTAKVTRDKTNEWTISGKVIQENEKYLAAVPSYLTTGNEKNLGYLNYKNPELVLVKEGRDCRLALRDYLKEQLPAD